MPELRIDEERDLKLSYKDEGPAGPEALILLHGFPFNSDLWRPQLEQLATNRRIIAPDLRGFGGSSLAPGRYTMAQLAADVVLLLDAIKIEQAVIGGLSMGGYVVFEFYRRYPGRVSGLLLADTRPEADSSEAKAARAKLAETATRHGARAVADQLIHRLLAPDTPATKPEIERHVRDMIESADPAALVAALAGMAERAESRTSLPEITVPVQVIVGSEDQICTPDEAHEWGGEIPDARVDVIDGAGHVSNLERPTAFNRILNRFLDETMKTLAAIALVMTASCGRVPNPPEPVPAAEPPDVSSSQVRYDSETMPELSAPQALPPTVSWLPAAPEEGTLVALIVEPASNGIPILEISGSISSELPRGKRTRVLALAQLNGGVYAGFIAAPLDSRELSLEVTATLVDGSKMSQALTVPVSSRNFPTTQLTVARRFTELDSATIERVRRERRLIQATLGAASAEPLLQGPFALPRADLTTSVFGQRRLFNNQLQSRHGGHDIDGDTGDPIYASNSGRVVLARSFFFNGNCVYIDHGLGLYTGYLHLSKFEVAEGEWVDNEQLIGRVGATGRVTGPHLHWSLHVQGTSLDPMSLLNRDFAGANDLLVGGPRPHPSADSLADSLAPQPSHDEL